MPSGLRKSVPLKMTSAISPPRSAFADCSPKTHRIASEIFDLPQPFGPTMAATPGTKFKVVLSAKDLKPRAVRLFKYMIVETKDSPRVCQEKTTMGWGVQILNAPTWYKYLVDEQSFFDPISH